MLARVFRVNKEDDFKKDNIAAANPDKEMLRLCSVRCPHMNEITLEDTLEALQKDQYVIEIDEEIRRRALRSVERMLAIG
jgi:quinolinate synthase